MYPGTVMYTGAGYQNQMNALGECLSVVNGIAYKDLTGLIQEVILFQAL